MTLILLLSSLLFNTPAVGFESTFAVEGQFVLFIENIEEETGFLRLALFSNEDSFLKEGAACYSATLEIEQQGNQTLTLPVFPVGKYSIAIFHDLNKDGKLNTNLWGIPTEPYAFSRTPNSKWKKPTFQNTHIVLGSATQEVRLQLKRWKQL